MLANLKFVPQSGIFQTVSGRFDVGDAASCRNVFCVTVFNETLEFLSRTLSSLAKSILYAEDSVSRRTAEYYLLLIFDGERHIDGNVAQWLKARGLVGAHCQYQCDDYRAYNSVRLIPDLAKSGWVGGAACADLAVCHVTVVIKTKNQGKLHSHKVFFDDYCQLVEPTYCYQIDAGTIIDPSALASLIENMNAKPRVGALAPCVLIPPPKAGGGLAEAWQYMDFMMQKAFGWPFEVLTGHLSVVPGQFSVFRWRALQGTAAERLSCPDPSSAPIVNYLRGPEDDRPLEAIMYLAEDRVVSTELVLARNSKWTVEYCAESNATTDACDTFSELLRQRRRWVNSTLACRVSLLSKMFEYLARSDRKASHKASFSLALLAQLILALIDVSAPASFFASVEVLVKVFWDGPSSVVGIKWAFLAAIVSAIGLSVVGNARAGPGLEAWSRNASTIMFVAANLLLFALFLGSLPLAASILVYSPLLLSFALTIRVGKARNKLNIAKHGAVYALINLVIAAVISAYSIWNLCDVSWGTKGLCTEEYKIKSQRLIRMRNVVFSVWVVFNIVLVAMALALPGLTSAALNPVVEVQCFLSIAMLAFVLVAGIRKARPKAFFPSKAFMR